MAPCCPEGERLLAAANATSTIYHRANARLTAAGDANYHTAHADAVAAGAADRATHDIYWTHLATHGGGA